MIPISIIFSTIAFYYECCKSGRKRERGSGVGVNSKSGKIPSFPDTRHVWVSFFYVYCLSNFCKTELSFAMAQCFL